MAGGGGGISDVGVGAGAGGTTAVVTVASDPVDAVVLLGVVPVVVLAGCVDAPDGTNAMTVASAIAPTPDAASVTTLDVFMFGMLRAPTDTGK